MRLLFIQLPRLDHDVSSPGENIMIAAACLQAALERTRENRHWCLIKTPASQDTATDAILIEHLTTLRPDIISATCYLWNIERTLALLKLLKKNLPSLRIVLGGPDIATNHPLLSTATTSPENVRVLGEGETVFPSILRFFRTGRLPNYHNVAWRVSRTTFIEGSRPRPIKSLQTLLPAPSHPVNRPDATGMAYLETNRGCPMRCAFCCYNIRRTTTTSLTPKAIATRIRILQQRGAKEIRLIDPTFNAHPQFNQVIRAMTQANRTRSIAFFVELRADTLTDDQARRLAAAGVVEAEVGIQSTDPNVLRIIHRPLPADRILRGIEALLRHGIKPTLDFMYALPAQDKNDLQRSLTWLTRFGNAIHPQFLPTLLLPGTELRDRARELGLRAQRLPPYRVHTTDILTTRQLAKIELLAREKLGGFDSPTHRFVGTRLPDLFADRLRLTLKANIPQATLIHRATSNRQALLISSSNLFAQRNTLSNLLRQQVLAEPHTLWQFVMQPTTEEPLDLFEQLIQTLRACPSHWLDRLVAPPGQRRLCARRIFVHLPRKQTFDPTWIDAVESILTSTFH